MNLVKTILGLLFFVFFQGYSLYKPFLQIPKTRLFQNLTLGVFNLAIIAIALNVAPVANPMQNTSDIPSALKVIVLIFAFDALSYVWHRANHQIPFLWQWHKFHHKEAIIDTSTAYRFHPIEVLLSLIPKGLLLWFMKASWQELLVFEILFTTSNLFQHSNFLLPKNVDKGLLTLFTTPSLHRHHHSIEPKNQQTNYGTIFTLWDRLLHTYKENTMESITTMGLKPKPSERFFSVFEEKGL